MKILDRLTSYFSSRIRAKLAYKRGMAKAKKHDTPGAIEEYTIAIGLPEIPPDIKAMALYNRALVYASTGDELKAIADLNAVLAMKQDLGSIKMEARRKLVRMKRRSDRNVGEVG